MSGQHLRAGRTDLRRSLRPRGRSNKGAAGSGGRDAPEECSSRSSSSHTDLVSSLGKADKALSRIVYEEASRVVPKPALKLLETCGSGLIWFPFAVAAVWATASSSPPMPMALPASNFLAGLILDIAIVGSVKGIVRRKRPNYSEVEGFEGYQTIIKVDSYSFPSGHTSRTVFIALFYAIFSAQLARTHQPWLSVFACAWAAATAASRVVLGRHYLLDVLAGSAAAVINVAVLTKGSFDASTLILDDATIRALVALLPGAHKV